MVEARRFEPWFGLLVAAVVGCSDSTRAVLETEPRPCGNLGASCPEGGGKQTDGAAGPSLELGSCFGENIDCTTDPQLQPYEAGPAITCTEVAEGTGTLLFSRSTTNINCPTPPCALSYSVMRTGTDGTLGLVGQLALPSGDMGGVWLADFAPGGELLREVVGEFGIPTRLSQQRFFVVSGVDAAQNGFVVELLGDVDHPRRATVLRYDASGGAPHPLTTIPNVVGTTITVASNGEFVAETQWWGNGLDAAQQDFASKELDVARYDTKGRLLWNQIKLSRALALTGVRPIGFDANGNLSLELVRETGNFVIGVDNSHPALNLHRVAQVDRNGNLKWLVELPTSAATDYAVAPNGSIYVLRQPTEKRDDGYYEVKPYLVERFDQSGHSAWTLEAPPSSFDPTLAVNADGDLLIATTQGGAGFPGSVAFHRISAQGDTCDAMEVPMDLCVTRKNGSTACSAPLIQPGPDGTIYFATESAVGRVAPP